MAPIPDLAHAQRSSNDAARDEHGIDLLAGLWKEAPFARLPPDAPAEFYQHVTDIDDPRRVYAIHRASRRHGFQVLVDKYIYQLRNGCGVSNCTVATCFTCRKRLAGKAPIRRYSGSSARTLAVYLASQENPEMGLCPTLRLPREASNVALNNLIFERTRRQPIFPREPKRSNSRRAPSVAKSKPHLDPAQTHSSNPSPEVGSQASSPRAMGRDRGGSSHGEKSPRTDDISNSEYTYKIHERPANKDHRSFAANLFGTVAFRMLEWLTPHTMTAISKKFDDPDSAPDSVSGSSGSSSASPKTDPAVGLNTVSKPSTILSGEPPEKLAPAEPPNSSSPKDPTKVRRGPETTFRSPHSSKPKRRASLEPPSPAVIEEPKSPTKSPRVNGFHPEKLARPLISNSTNVPRGFPDVPTKPAFFENVSPPSPTPDRGDWVSATRRGDHGDPPTTDTDDSKSNAKAGEGDKTRDHKLETDTMTEVQCPLPQTLRIINADIVDFFCDVFHDDNTGEEPIETGCEVFPQPLRGKTPLRRARRTHNAISRRQWKAFNEQTLFDVLSDPGSLIASFTANGDLFDSHTLWYCMARLTRAAPNLVLHSLWMAADSLFVPPRALQELGFKKTKLFRRNRKALSFYDAGCVMSICLHALAGSTPVCPDSSSLSVISRVRSKGITLSTFTNGLDQPSWLREQYDDAFSNDLAVRLARRLFCALTARRRFAEMLEAAPSKEQDDGIGMDILDPLFNQIDILGLEATPVLGFADQFRSLHEGRIQILTLEWARTVLFNDWDGKPDFGTSGPFAGALSLIESMCKSTDPIQQAMFVFFSDFHQDEQRELLQLVDQDFQVDYFSDRLDFMDVPIAWLSFTSTSQRRHLLDYPYLFTPNTLISFFRSINFSRMSQTFEESSSLKTRMNAIVDRGSLITNPHHKMVLQDLLKTASSRYLILEISRDNVIRDAFDQLWRREGRELLRPLKVHLGEDSGEEGFDSGGVQQEFFRLAIAEFLDPCRGAFTVDDRTRMAWFAPGSVVELWKFELLGVLVSLAIFNGLTLPVTFPKALYRKLLNWPVDELHHIEDGWPDLAGGLAKLQEWDEEMGTVEDVFARTYEFSVLTYGSHVTRHMSAADAPWPQVQKEAPSSANDDEEAPLVTKDNRERYVADYIRYLTDVSVRPQFTAFERGFRTCLEPKSLGLLTPSTLQSLVEGVQEIDISELRRVARYVGWEETHRTIKDFWSIVKRYDEAMKRRLLEFVTASDRLPVGGVRNLQFVVQKNGSEEDDGHLPTAYTCYGTLLLPEYKDKESLRERLAMALENAQGFGFA